MNRKTTLAVIVTGLITTTSAIAVYDADSPKGGREHKSEHCMKGGKHGSFNKKDIAKLMTKEFSAEEVRTLSEARLIMKGNPNVRVDEVESTNTGYNVTIVTQDNSLVEELKLAKNAMPLERFEQMQQRIEPRQNGERSEHHSKKGDGEHSERRAKKGARGHGHKGPRGQIGHKVMEREFSADEITTLTQAKLIMRGNPNVKVGTVSNTDTGYTVTIVTQDDSLVEKREVAKNGLPLAQFEKMQKRMEMRKERQNTQ